VGVCYLHNDWEYPGFVSDSFMVQSMYTCHAD